MASIPPSAGRMQQPSPPLSELTSPTSVRTQHLDLIAEFDPISEGSSKSLVEAEEKAAEHGEKDVSGDSAASSAKDGLANAATSEAPSQQAADEPSTPQADKLAAVAAAMQKYRKSRKTQDAEGSGSNRSSLDRPRGTTAESPIPKTPSRVVETSKRSRRRSQDSEQERADGPQFDFQGFLVQLRQRQAEPIQKYLKSFLVNFAKRPFTINEQIKLIHDFLDFISGKMRQIEPWKSQDRQQFDNAIEAMEKLVMNRLYTYTFVPMIDASSYPVTTDDLERDGVLSQRIRLFGWVRAKHLDVPEGEASQGFLAFAEQELLKINHYKAPRDKMICILNCCKVIFGLIRHQSGSEIASADQFLPILIYVVLRANPDNLLSNIEYIQRFRRPEKLEGEAAYYLTNLAGAVSFIETLDASGLSNITREEFERNVEAAISDLPPGSPRAARSASTVHAPLSNTAEGEEPARDLSALPGNLAFETRKFFQKTGELATGAVGKLIESIQPDATPRANDSQDVYRTPPPRPSFRYPGAASDAAANPRPRRTYDPYSENNERRETASPIPERLQIEEMYARSQLDFSAPPSGTATPGDDPTFNFDALTAEIDRTHETAREAGVDTLRQMFPAMDGEVAGMVLDGCDGDLGMAIDRMLEMASAA